jgi:hypothetical protein
MIVKALGLRQEIKYNPFTDVKADEWYAGYVGTAFEYKLITGNGSSSLSPMKDITREEVMLLMDRAMKLTDLKAEQGSEDTELELAGFTDEAQVSEWARSSAVSCIKSGLILGRNSTMLAPKDNITRAEAAVIIRRLLQKSNFIQ